MFRVIIFISLVVLSALGRDCDLKFQGCKIDYRERKCVMGEAVGCENPFPYRSLDECWRDFSGHGNICDHKNHCHTGLCLPVSKVVDGKRIRNYKCDCHGTGFYGKHCEHKCKAKLPKHNHYAEACLSL